MLNLYLLKNVVSNITRRGSKLFSFNVLYKLLCLLKIKLLKKEVLKKINRFRKHKKINWWKKKRKNRKKIVYIRTPIYFIFKVFRRLDPLFKTTVFYKSGIKYVFPTVASLTSRCNMVMRWLLRYSCNKYKELDLSYRLSKEFFETWGQSSSTYLFANELKILIQNNSRLLYLRRRRSKIRKRKKKYFFNLIDHKTRPSKWFRFPYKSVKKLKYRNKKEKKYFSEYVCKDYILNKSLKDFIFKVEKWI